MAINKKWIIVIACVLVLLAGLACFAFFGFAQPYARAANTMPPGQMALSVQDDGGILLTWPEAEGTDGYELLVLEPGEDTASDVSAAVPAGDEILHVWPEENSYVLQDLPTDREIEIRVGSYCDYRTVFSDEIRRRAGEASLSICGVFRQPAAENLTWQIAEQTDTLTVRFDLPQNGVCRVYHSEGNAWEQIDSLTAGETSIRFGDDTPFPLPDHEQTHLFAFDVVCTFDGYTYTGVMSEPIVIGRQGFLGTELNAVWTDEGSNAYSVTWDETKGDSYAVQRYDAVAGEWIDIHTVEQDGERTFSTGHLAPYTNHQYRVVAVGGQETPDNPYAAVSGEYAVSTGSRVIYSTIWPIKDLKVYKDTAQSAALGTAPEGTAYCVLGVEGNYFRIRFGGEEGYIDNRYCMINLAEMLGGLCSYDIRNSYSSIYKIHDYDIPDVTGTVITGYEKIRLSNGNYLVPLLYPAALKLEEAALEAVDQGYRLKIYDSYRPKKATIFLYDLAEKMIEDPVPGQKQPTVETTPEGETVPPEKLVTYFDVMTDNGRYGLNYFLARGGSRHNQGIALDLTLEKISTGKDLQMQTAMHDLSWYSENNENNSSANKLRSIMLDAGFTGLVSEWWHFQDNDAKDQLNPPYMRGGVTPECWMADDAGWRYRTASGKYLTDTTREIDGISYTFDQNGYVIEPEEEAPASSSDSE